MSTHPVRRLFPQIHARHRRTPRCAFAHRCAFHAFGDSAKHAGRVRRLGPLAVARTPEKQGVFEECLLQNISGLCYDVPTTKAHSLATMGLDCSALGGQDRGPMTPSESTSKDGFHEQG